MAPPLCHLKQMQEDLLQHYDCTDQPAAAQPAPPSGGSAAANAGANLQPQPADSQDNGDGKLVLPQLNRLHEAFKRSQVSHPASYSSQDQQPSRQPSPIPSQRRLTQLLTKHWPQFKALRQHYASTRFEEQRQLHLPQKHKATVPESSVRVEMNAREEQADNAKARDLYWKPLSWLGTIRPSSANDALTTKLWATFVSTTLGLVVTSLSSLPRHHNNPLAKCGCKKTPHGLSRRPHQHLVFDLSMTQDSFGSSSHVQQNGLLSNPKDLDAPLRLAAQRKINGYRQQYADNQNIYFLPTIMSTSTSMHGEFLRLLFP